MRWIVLLLCVLILPGIATWAAPPAVRPAQTAQGSLWPTEDQLNQPQAYHAQEGDLIFFTARSFKYAFFHFIARSYHPYHVGIIVKRVTGELGVLENGALNHDATSIQPISARMRTDLSSAKYARIWVRKFRREIRREESLRLTAFSEGQLGRSSASSGRFALIAVPGRPAPKTKADQPTWICSEVVAQAIVSSKIVDRSSLAPEKVTPYDLMLDKSDDLENLWSKPYIFSPTLGPPPPGPTFAYR